MTVNGGFGEPQSPLDIMRENIRTADDLEVQRRYIDIVGMMMERLAERDPQARVVVRDWREGWFVEELRNTVLANEGERPHSSRMAELRDRYRPGLVEQLKQLSATRGRGMS